MKICKAFKEDLDEILKLQYLAYQSEAMQIKKQNHIIRYRNDECLQLKKEQVL